VYKLEVSTSYNSTLVMTLDITQQDSYLCVLSSKGWKLMSYSQYSYTCQQQIKINLKLKFPLPNLKSKYFIYCKNLKS